MSFARTACRRAHCRPHQRSNGRATIRTG